MSALPIDMDFTGSELGAKVALRGPDNKDYNFAPRGQTVRAGQQSVTVHPTPEATQKSQNDAKNKAEQKLDPRVRRLAARQRMAPGWYKQRLARLKLAPAQRVLANSAEPSRVTKQRRRQRNAYKGLDPNQTRQVPLDKSNVMSMATKARNDIEFAKKILSRTPEGAIMDLVKKAIKATVKPAPKKLNMTAPALATFAPQPAANGAKRPGVKPRNVYALTA